MSRPQTITGSLRQWSRKGNCVTGYVYEDKTFIYSDGTFVVKDIRNIYEFDDHWILKTHAFVYLLMKSEEKKNE